MAANGPVTLLQRNLMESDNINREALIYYGNIPSSADTIVANPLYGDMGFYQLPSSFRLVRAEERTNFISKPQSVVQGPSAVIDSYQMINPDYISENLAREGSNMSKGAWINVAFAGAMNFPFAAIGRNSGWMAAIELLDYKYEKAYEYNYGGPTDKVSDSLWIQSDNGGIFNTLLEGGYSNGVSVAGTEWIQLKENRFFLYPEQYTAGQTNSWYGETGNNPVTGYTYLMLDKSGPTTSTWKWHIVVFTNYIPAAGKVSYTRYELNYHDRQLAEGTRPRFIFFHRDSVCALDKYDRQLPVSGADLVVKVTLENGISFLTGYDVTQVSDDGATYSVIGREAWPTFDYGVY